MEKQTKKGNDSGEVRVKEDTVYWIYDKEIIFQVNLNDIAIIGEYTNSDGPWLDDWFLTFVTKDGHWHSIPMYADNINEELLKDLNSRFHQEFTMLQLANSTEWKSVVHYPPHLKGKPLFILTPSATYREPKNFLEKFLSGLGLGNFDTTKDVNLTAEIKDELVNDHR